MLSVDGTASIEGVRMPLLGNYHSRVLGILLRDPLKAGALLRLRSGGEHARLKCYQRDDGFSAPPITIGIRPSYRCNLKCIQCSQWGRQGLLHSLDHTHLACEELSTTQIKDFIKEISVFKPYLYFTGGEPLLRSDIAELIAYANQLHLLTSMSSNATLLCDRAEEIINAGLDYLYVSLDAPDETNLRIRQGSNSFARAVEGIKTVLRLRETKGKGLPVVQVQTIIIKENQDKLLAMAEFVERELKADVWGLQLCVFTSPDLNKQTEKLYAREFGVDACHWRGFVMEFSGLEYRVLEEQLQKIMRTPWSFRLRLYNPLADQKFSFRTYFEQPQEFMVRPPCMYPWAFAQLQPNADVAFCGSQPDYVIGNIRDEKFLKMWNGERARRFRSFIKNKPLPSCSRCFALFEFSHYR